MADWRDVMRTRHDADEAANQWFVAATLTTNDPGICGMLEALRLELRALATALDYHHYQANV